MIQSADNQLSLLGRMMPRWEPIELPDAEVRLCRDFLLAGEAQRLFEELRDGIPWKQDRIKFYGKEHPVPRLHQWYGDPGLTYKWSGITMHPEPWSPLVQRIRARAEEVAGSPFNTVLLNLYRDGNDSVSWHADDEPELGETPIIASISLGAEREFLMRHNEQKELGLAEKAILLPHGSLLLMAGETQRHWQHSIPKRKGVKGPRINLTFRWVSGPSTEKRRR